MTKFLFLFSILTALLVSSCGKKEEQQVYVPPGQETKKDPEQERLEREEFERLKRLETGDTVSQKDTASFGIDTTTARDTSLASSEKKTGEEKSGSEREGA